MAQRIEFHLGADGPVLSAFMACRAPFSSIRGGLGSGKTTGSCQRLLHQLTEQAPNARGVRPSRWLVVRNTYLDLTQTTIKDFLAVFEGLGTMRYGGLEPPNFHVQFNLEDGSSVDAEIIFLALDRDDAIRKLKGYQVTGIWFNELSEISKAIVDMADLRHGRYPSEISGGVRCSWHGIFGDTNSFDEDHWLYRVAEIERPKDWRFFHQPGGVLDTGRIDSMGRKVWAPNPRAENLSNLPDGYYVRGMQGKSDDWIKVMLANEYGFTVSGKPMHPQYVDSVHCASEPFPPDPAYPIILGLDWGRTPAAAFTQYLKAMGRRTCFDEMTSENMSASIFAPELKRYIDREYPGFPVIAYGDPAGDGKGQATEDTPMLICRAAGIPVVPAPSNVLAVRLAALDNPMTRLCMDGRPAFMLSPKAKKIRKGLMGAYHRRKLQISGPDARYSDDPEKNDASHPCEALHYAFLGSGEYHTALRAPVNEELQREMHSYRYSEPGW